MPVQPSLLSSKNIVRVPLDLRVVVLALLAVIAGMLLLWRPWSASPASERTVEVRGESTIRAKPDEFVFYPSYEFRHADKAAALAELGKKSDDVITKLKSFGVKEKDIKTSTSGYDDLVYRSQDSGEATYRLQLTVTVDSLDLAQKVQDYLVTTTPTGSVSPQPGFSEAKRTMLEAQARDLATKDARATVDQMARNVGFKVGKVKNISEDQGFSVMPFEARSMAADEKGQSPLAVQPGENELPYTITVTYYIR